MLVVCPSCFDDEVQAAIVGFYHYFVLLGTTILIHNRPFVLFLLLNDKAKVIQTLLFAIGLNTLLQSWFGMQLLVVVGGSYVFHLPILTIIYSKFFRWLSALKLAC